MLIMRVVMVSRGMVVSFLGGVVLLLSEGLPRRLPRQKLRE